MKDPGKRPDATSIAVPSSDDTYRSVHARWHATAGEVLQQTSELVNIRLMVTKINTNFVFISHARSLNSLDKRNSRGICRMNTRIR